LPSIIYLHKIQGHGAPEVKRLVKTNSQRGHFLEKGLAGRVPILTFKVTHARATGEWRSDWKPIGKQTSALNCKLKEKSRKGTIMEISSRLNCHTTMMLTSTLECFVRTLIERK